MADLNRRQTLLVGVGAIAAAALPAVAPAEAALAPAEILPAWAVGTPGEFNWQHVVAKTSEEAKRIFRAEWITDDCEGEEDGPCGECEACTLDIEFERVEAWDGRKDIVAADWLDVGMGAHCQRCSYECFADNGAKNVNGEAVCEDCLSLEDWDIIDPEYAAELRAEPTNSPALISQGLQANE